MWSAAIVVIEPGWEGVASAAAGAVDRAVGPAARRLPVMRCRTFLMRLSLLTAPRITRLERTGARHSSIVRRCSGTLEL
jgi:hypothetical protein